MTLIWVKDEKGETITKYHGSIPTKGDQMTFVHYDSPDEFVRGFVSSLNRQIFSMEDMGRDRGHEQWVEVFVTGMINGNFVKEETDEPT